ncbi:MAG: hypothetical protein EPN88_13895 [Bacteroidetes bacterium]|nr:MAG: hypothetical protein EPN88_13895 [Bacteroidota bacterium]
MLGEVIYNHCVVEDYFCRYCNKMLRENKEFCNCDCKRYYGYEKEAEERYEKRVKLYGKK